METAPFLNDDDRKLLTAGKLRLLYVEDSRFIRLLIVGTLKRFFAGVEEAESGKAGLERFRNDGPFDLVVTDINMPEMDGIQMVREIRKMDRNVPIVISTSFTDETHLVEAIKLKVNGFVTKSEKPDELVEEVVKNALALLRKKELDEKNRLLLQNSRLAAMGEITSMLAHQWRQPLTLVSMSITNVLLDLERGEVNNETLRRRCNQMQEQVSYLSGVIGKFTSSFRDESAPVPVRLPDVIDDALELIGEELVDKGVRILRDYPGTVPSLTLYRNEILQAFLNLFINAKEVLENRKVEEPELRVAVSLEKGGLVATVEDNGQGISDEHIDRIFEPYYTTKPELNKAGLGLYVAKLAVEDQEGCSLRAENGPQGARFTLFFPLES